MPDMDAGRALSDRDESENTDEEVIQDKPKPAAKSLWGSLM